MSTRFATRFAALGSEGRGALVPFITAGDPDLETSRAILDGLPAAGADIIELGMPFTDPVGDGPAVQLASQRALAAGGSMRNTLAMVRDFRKRDDDTPIVLMGYYNPIHHYGVEMFAKDAAEAGVDGLIIVDLPPEEEDELRGPVGAAGIDIIRLIAPTTDEARLPLVLEGTGGFVYYVSVTGVTGGKTAATDTIPAAVARIRKHTDLPIAVGFGITTPDGAAEVVRNADGAAVGSAIVRIIADNTDQNGRSAPDVVDKVLGFVAELSAGVRSARG